MAECDVPVLGFIYHRFDLGAICSVHIYLFNKLLIHRSSHLFTAFNNEFTLKNAAKFTGTFTVFFSQQQCSAQYNAHK